MFKAFGTFICCTGLLLGAIVFGGCQSDKERTAREVSANQAAIARAAADTEITKSTNQAAMMDTLAAAAKPDNTVLIIVLFLVGSGLFIVFGSAVFLYAKHQDRGHELQLKRLELFAAQGRSEEPPMPLSVIRFIEERGGIPVYEDNMWKIMNGRTRQITAVERNNVWHIKS